MSKEIAESNETHVIPMVHQKADYVAMAIEKGADLATIEKFMDLQERNDKYEAKKLYVTAMATFRADCPSIVKTKKGHNSKYAGLAETIDQIKGILAKCGLSHSWRTEQKDSKIIVTCIVTHVAGHSESTSLESPPETSGSKNAIQAIGSAIEYMKRYTFFAILGLSSGDEDNDGGGIQDIERITDEQAMTIQSKIEDNGLDMDQFKNWLHTRFKCSAINELNAAAYQDVITTIDNQIKKKAKK